MGFFVKAAQICRCTSVHGIMFRFTALFSHAGSSMSHQGGYVRAWRRLCGRGGSGGRRGLPGRLRKVSRTRLEPDVLVLLRGRRTRNGWRGGTERRRACGCNRRSRWGLLIHVFHFQLVFPSSDVYSPPVISPDFSLLLPLTSELCPPSIHPLSPFTCRLLFCSFLPLHLSYIPMVHLGCGCQLRPGSYYYPGCSFRLQFSMTKIRAARKNITVWMQKK